MEHKARGQGIGKCLPCLEVGGVSSPSLEVCKHRQHPGPMVAGGGRSSHMEKGKC